MKPLSLVFNILFLVLSAFAQDGPLQIHVSPEGSETGDGSQGQPYGTLVQARDHIRSVTTSGGMPEGGIQVIVHKGNYTVSGSLELEGMDSGEAGSPVVYRSLPGEVAHFFGGTILQNDWFTKALEDFTGRIVDTPARGHIIEIPLREHGLEDYGKLVPHGYTLEPPGRIPPVMLSVGGERMWLARWPNVNEDSPYLENKGRSRGHKGMVSYTGIIDPGPARSGSQWYRNEVFMNCGGTIRVAFDRIKYWKEPSGIFLDGVLSKPWEWTYNRVTSINVQERAITLARGEVGTINYRYQGGTFFYFENIPEELDEPGEYYIDRSNGMLYLYPPEGFADKTVVLTTLSSPVIVVSGASHVRFENMFFDTGRNVFARVNGNNIEFRDCTIANFILGGIDIQGRNNTVRGCDIHGIGGWGVMLEGGDLNTLAPSGNVVEYCEIRDYGWDQKSQIPAVTLRGVGNVSSHNRTTRGPHYSHRIYGNDNIIEYNEIFGLPTYHFFDGGSIYINLTMHPEQRGNMIRHNFFHEVTTIGAYLDNFACGTRVYGNLFVKVGYVCDDCEVSGQVHFPGVAINGGGQNEIWQNIFVDCGTPVDNYGWAPNSLFNDDWMAAWKRIQDRFPNGAAGTPWEKYPRFGEFLAYEAREDFQYQHSYIHDNLFFNPRVPFTSNAAKGSGVVDGTGALVTNRNIATKQDPGFIDRENGNYGLTGDAAVYQLIEGFPDIEFQKMGLEGYVPGVK